MFRVAFTDARDIRVFLLLTDTMQNCGDKLLSDRLNKRL